MRKLRFMGDRIQAMSRTDAYFIIEILKKF